MVVMAMFSRRAAGVLLSTVVVSLFAPSPAHGLTVSHAEFDAALASVSATAGVFATGTTLVAAVEEPTNFHSLSFSVNPNGSLVRVEKSFDDVLSAYRCVRVDRCWGMALGAFGNLKWHALPKGAVFYRQARDFWADWLDLDWPPDAVFDVSAGSDGTRVFTVTATDEDGTVWRSVTLFRDATLTSVDTVSTPGQDPVQTITVKMSAQDTPVRVLAPPVRLIGRPARDVVPQPALINS